MTHPFRRVSLASAVACAALVGPVAGAQASDASIRATVKTDVPKIVKSQAKILDGLATYEKTRSSAALIKAIKAQTTTLKGLKTKLAGESPSSASGTKGKADIDKGLTLIIGSNDAVDSALAKHAKGQPVSTAKIKAAISADEKGNKDLNAGGKLLKV